MKRAFKTGVITLLCIFAMTACEEEYSLGTVGTISSDQVVFSATPSSQTPNRIVFANTSDTKGVIYSTLWDLGNGATGRGETITGEYPYAGDYTVTLTLYAPDGSASSKSQVITVAEDDFSLLDRPDYNNLTGGADNADGKTWVLQQYVAGHFGVGPVNADDGDNTSPSWWSCPVEGKLESSLYQNEFNFKMDGLTLTWTNNGKIYTNEAGKNALAALGYPNSSVPGAGDFDVEYTPNASYTFSLNETDGTITLSDGAFFGHYAGASTYTIVTLTEDELYIRCDSKTETTLRWWYRFVPKEKNVKPEVPLQAIALADDFESETPAVNLEGQDMGELTSSFYSNPAPFGINTSPKVFAYQKSEAFYSNIFFSASTYKFDLSTVNKVKMKVYIPSYNDYDTENAVAGDWISEKRLRPQVAIKLQDNSMGDSAWETQTEIIRAGLEMNKWLELEFDFSNVSDRTDYDKIVIQFGGEGHAGPGIFFFDDFEFGE